MMRTSLWIVLFAPAFAALALGIGGGCGGAGSLELSHPLDASLASDGWTTTSAVDSSGSDASASDASPPFDGGAGTQACPMLVVDAGPASQWAYVDTPGHLAYETLPKGERLLDFSSAGYMGGGVAIPTVAVAQTVMPSGGADDTPAIQAAIDAVAKLPATGGVRGAVLLTAGTFQLGGTLAIATSGVVLRGSGSGAGGTVLQVTGAPRTVLSIAGTGTWAESTTVSAKITDAYVPSGAISVHVSSTAGLSAGAAVLIDRPVTAGWIHFMGMDTMVRNGMPETWLSAGSTIHSDRTIVSVAGDTITFDAPITDTFDLSTWGAGAAPASVHPYTFSGRIAQVGIEAIHLVAPLQTVPINQPTFAILDMNAVVDAWVRDVAGDEFTTGFVVGSTAKRVTIEDSSVKRVAPIDGSQGYPFHFSVDGQSILVQRCSSLGDGVFSYATQQMSPGPNVVLQMSTPEDDAGPSHTNLQPHQRWSTGLLVDSAATPIGGISLMNRGWDGSGHGWAIGFGVVWNGEASSLLIQQPPGAQNWAIGAQGTQTKASAPGSNAGDLPQGIIDSPGVAVAPASLYLAQLCERLGPAALAAIAK